MLIILIISPFSIWVNSTRAPGLILSLTQAAAGGSQLALLPVDADLLQVVGSCAATAGLPPVLEGARLPSFEHAHEPFARFRPTPEMDLVVATFIGNILGGPSLVVAGLHPHIRFTKSVFPDHIAPHPGEAAIGAPG